MSEARTAANRKNSESSTGPITPEGKARSSRNSTKHGITSKALILPTEDPEEYQRLRESIVASWAPANEHEEALADVIAQAFWRRQRLYRLETTFMSSRMNELASGSEGGEDALIRMFTDPAEMTRARLLLRYVSAAERSYRNAVADLEKVQANRRELEESACGETLASDGSESSDEFFINAMLTRLETPSQDPNGFVSHTDPAHRKAES